MKWISTKRWRELQAHTADLERTLVAERATNESLLKANHQYRNRIDELRGQLARVPEVPVPAEMTEKEGLQALSGWPAEDARLRVVLQFFDDHKELARVQAEAADLQDHPGQVSYYLGGAAWIEQTKAAFLAAWQHARTTLAKKPPAG